MCAGILVLPPSLWRKHLVQCALSPRLREIAYGIGLASGRDYRLSQGVGSAELPAGVGVGNLVQSLETGSVAAIHKFIPTANATATATATIGRMGGGWIRCEIQSPLRSGLRTNGRAELRVGFEHRLVLFGPSSHRLVLGLPRAPRTFHILREGVDIGELLEGAEITELDCVFELCEHELEALDTGEGRDVLELGGVSNYGVSLILVV